jgi:outer membrane receptor protein involved in Fe transport
VLRAAAEVSRRFDRGLLLGRASTSRTSATFRDERTSGTTERELDDNSTALAIQAGLEPASRVSLTGGGRVEWRAAGDRGAERDGRTAAIGRLAGAVRLNDLVTLRGAAATSHRWPTLNEMVRDFSAGSATTRANPDLEPERARSIEGGATVARGAWSVTATAFRAVVLDAISNVTLSSGSTIVRERRNAGEAHSHGLELDAEITSGVLRLRGSLTALDARFRQSQEPALEGNWLPQIPATAFAVSGDLRLPARHVLSLVFARSSPQFDDDRNVFRLSSSARLDARLAGVVDAGRVELGWHMSAENLTDARIETGRTPLVALAQGRAIRIGLSIRY